MAKITDFLDYILAEIPCTKAMASAKIRQTCSDFCGRSNVWRYKPGTIKTRKDAAEYLIPRLSGTTVVKVLKLKDIDADISYTPAVEGNDRSGFVFYHPEPHTIVLKPTPNESRYLTIEVSLKPLLTADTVDDILIDRWSDAIIEGTLYRLKSMPGKQWTDVATATRLHHVEYEKQLRKALDIALRGHSDAQIVVHPPSGGYF